MMRRGPGIGGLKKQAAAREQFSRLGAKIESEDTASVRSKQIRSLVVVPYSEILVSFIPKRLSFIDPYLRNHLDQCPTG